MIRILHPKIGAVLLSWRFSGKLIVALLLITIALMVLYPVLLFFGILPWIGQGEPEVSIGWVVGGPLFSILPLKAVAPLCVSLQNDAVVLFKIWRAKRVYILSAAFNDPMEDLSSQFLLVDSSNRRSHLALSFELAKVIAGDVWAASEAHLTALRLLPRDLLNWHEKFKAKKEFILEFLEGQKREAALLECDEIMLQKMELDHAYLLSWLATLGQMDAGQDLDRRIAHAERAGAAVSDVRLRARMDEDLGYLKQRKHQLSMRVGNLEAVERELEAIENRLQYLHDGLSLRSSLENFREPVYVPSSLLDELRLDA